MTPEDWVDAEGRMHDPPRFEVVMDHCPACAEIGRVQTEFAARLPKEQLEAERIKAGVLFKVVPFDPRRDVPSIEDFVGAPQAMQPEPSLADPVMEGGRILTPDG